MPRTLNQPLKVQAQCKKFMHNSVPYLDVHLHGLHPAHCTCMSTSCGLRMLQSILLGILNRTVRGHCMGNLHVFLLCIVVNAGYISVVLSYVSCSDWVTSGQCIVVLVLVPPVCIFDKAGLESNLADNEFLPLQTSTPPECLCEEFLELRMILAGL